MDLGEQIKCAWFSSLSLFPFFFFWNTQWNGMKTPISIWSKFYWRMRYIALFSEWNQSLGCQFVTGVRGYLRERHRDGGDTKKEDGVWDVPIAIMQRQGGVRQRSEDNKVPKESQERIQIRGLKWSWGHIQEMKTAKMSMKANQKINQMMYFQNPWIPLQIHKDPSKRIATIITYFRHCGTARVLGCGLRMIEVVNGSLKGIIINYIRLDWRLDE
jgi:hypothetical protein